MAASIALGSIVSFSLEAPMADAMQFSRPAKTKTASERDASAEECLTFERVLVDLSARFAIFGIP